MKYIIEEQILFYEKDQSDKWSRGDKSLIPEFMEKHPEFYKQKTYHFGEIYVISQFHQKYGWKGFYPIALGRWEPDNRKYDSCRQMIHRLLPIEKLLKFRDLRKELDNNKKGSGEPDVMLYNDKKEVLFIEVKRGNDVMSDAQLTCLAHIKSILEAEVGVVYVCEAGKKYTPKKYELDLEDFSFKRL